MYRAEGVRCLAAAHGGRKSLSVQLQVQKGVGRTAGSARRNRDTMNYTSFLGCFWSSRVSPYSPTAFFLIQYLTISRTVCEKTAKSERREYEEGMRFTFKYAKKGAASTEVKDKT